MNNRLKDALMYCGVWETPQTYGKSYFPFDARYWEIQLIKMLNWNGTRRTSQ